MPLKVTYANGNVTFSFLYQWRLSTEIIVFIACLFLFCCLLELRNYDVPFSTMVGPTGNVSKILYNIFLMIRVPNVFDIIKQPNMMDFQVHVLKNHRLSTVYAEG